MGSPCCLCIPLCFSFYICGPCRMERKYAISFSQSLLFTLRLVAAVGIELGKLEASMLTTNPRHVHVLQSYFTAAFFTTSYNFIYVGLGHYEGDQQIGHKRL
jgi:hypothetical protein